MGELAPVGHGRGAISKVIEGKRRQVGVCACMPAAAGWPCGLISNHLRTRRTDSRPRVTTCTHKTRVRRGKGCEGGAARLRECQ